MSTKSALSILKAFVILSIFSFFVCVGASLQRVVTRIYIDSKLLSEIVARRAIK